MYRKTVLMSLLSFFIFVFAFTSVSFGKATANDWNNELFHEVWLKDGFDIVEFMKEAYDDINKELEEHSGGLSAIADKNLMYTLSITQEYRPGKMEGTLYLLYFYHWVLASEIASESLKQNTPTSNQSYESCTYVKNELNNRIRNHGELVAYAFGYEDEEKFGRIIQNCLNRSRKDFIREFKNTYNFSNFLVY